VACRARAADRRGALEELPRAGLGGPAEGGAQVPHCPTLPHTDRTLLNRRYGLVVVTVKGSRVLVVGASSGLGRGIADRLDRDGATVAVAARRVERLRELADSRDRMHVVALDVQDEVGCADAVAGAVELMGGLDAVVYAPGITVLSRLAKVSAEHWRTAFEVNVVGASLVTAAAMPHLEASEGVAIFLSSVSASLTPPWIGMGVYAATKMALEKTVQVWNMEHPRVRFSTIVVGATRGGEFFQNAIVPFPDDTDAFFDEWRRRGYTGSESLEIEDQAQAVVDIMESRAQMDTVWVRSRTHLQFPPEEPPSG
jgi:NADP-dependent 3-hydroxy acid dehydrogenase YdfG